MESTLPIKKLRPKNSLASLTPYLKRQNVVFNRYSTVAMMVTKLLEYEIKMCGKGFLAPMIPHFRNRKEQELKIIFLKSQPCVNSCEAKVEDCYFRVVESEARLHDIITTDEECCTKIVILTYYSSTHSKKKFIFTWFPQNNTVSVIFLPYITVSSCPESFCSLEENTLFLLSLCFWLTSAVT